MSEHMMTNSDIAEMVKVPLATVRQWRYQGTGPMGYRVGKHVRYRREDVEQWLKGRKDGAALAPGEAG